MYMHVLQSCLPTVYCLHPALKDPFFRSSTFLPVFKPNLQSVSLPFLFSSAIFLFILLQNDKVTACDDESRPFFPLLKFL